MSIHQLLSNDSRVKKLNKRIIRGGYAVPTDKMTQEIISLHAIREVRNIEVKDVLLRYNSKFLGSVLNNQKSRSRIVEIQVSAFKTLVELKRVTTALKKYLSSTYSAQLARAASTQNDRNAILDGVIEGVLERQGEIEAVIEIAKLIIADIDQAGFTVKAINDIVLNSMDKSKKI